MPKLGLTILPIMFALTGIGFSQSVGAKQIQNPLTEPFGHRHNSVRMPLETRIDNLYSISLAVKKCSIRRYRRPR
jgi:hypothetical protein